MVIPRLEEWIWILTIQSLTMEFKHTLKTRMSPWLRVQMPSGSRPYLFPCLRRNSPPWHLDRELPDQMVRCLLRQTQLWETNTTPWMGTWDLRSQMKICRVYRPPAIRNTDSCLFTTVLCHLVALEFIVARPKEREKWVPNLLRTIERNQNAGQATSRDIVTLWLKSQLIRNNCSIPFLPPIPDKGMTT